MAFFPDLPEPEPPPPLPEAPPQGVSPEWAGPPHGVLPGLSDQRAIVFHTPETAMSIDRFLVYPTGLLFTASVILREPRTPVSPAMPWELEHPRRHRDPVDPDHVLRIGVLFSDGRKWTNVDEVLASSSEQNTEPPAIVLSARDGSSGPLGWEASFWLWPLPPKGPLAFVVAWPAYEIDETSQSLDADGMLELAAEPAPLWRTS